jgi:hypothetical protein
MSMHSRAGSLLSLVTAGLLVAACGGSPAASADPGPTASPVAVTPAPTASPSPTPVADVSKLFTAQLVNPQFEGAGPISGSMTIGNLAGSIAGTMQMKGKDTTFEMTIEIPNVLSSTSASVEVDGTEYTSKDGGPWFKAEAPATDSGLSTAVSVAALTATDAGIVTMQGQQLHHMVPGNAGTITAADLGMTDPSMADAKGTLDFYARDDGSLAVMSVGLEWTVDSGGTPVPVAMTLDFAFDENPTVSIAPPDEIWTRYTSKQHAYTIGYPADWQLIKSESADEMDLFAYSSTQFAGGMRERQPKAASDRLDAYVRAFLKATPTKPEVNQATSVAGEDAWRIAYHDTVNGEELYFVFTLLIDGRNGYQVVFVGPKGYESDIVAFHEVQLTTLAIPGR